jgi:hypothetical protein
MEEDVLGTMRAISTSTSDYVECSRCTKMVLRQDVHLVPSTALDAVSEYEQLCPDCYAALAEGDQELPISEP